jgi:chemotaxis response regulator CheB
VVGEASNFAKTMQMIVDYRPDVLLLDLHLAEKRDLKPHIVKAQLAGVKKVVAVSFSNDDEAKELARSTVLAIGRVFRVPTKQPYALSSLTCAVRCLPRFSAAATKARVLKLLLLREKNTTRPSCFTASVR